MGKNPVRQFYLSITHNKRMSKVFQNVVFFSSECFTDNSSMTHMFVRISMCLQKQSRDLLKFYFFPVA